MCGWLASFPRQRGDPSFWITPPLHVDAKWTAFCDTAHLPTTPLPPSPAYTRSSGPTSAWALHPALPDAPLVTSSACPDCGRPTPHTAFVDLPTSPTDHWPHFFCTSPHKAPPVCTRDIAARCVVGFQGMLLPGAVPVSAIPWAAPCAPPPDRLLQPTPAFVLSLPDPRDQASTPLRDTALTFLTHTWGGIAGQVSLARTWLEALSPDVVAEQELWDLASARPALPPRYEAHYSTASGQGSGLRTAWLRSLRAPSQPADLVYDGQHWIASALPLSLGGRALLFNAHLPPRLSYSEWVSEVKLMNHLRSRVRPDLCVLLGDLNSSGAPGTPLASALGALGPLSAWHRLVPPATPTNFMTRHGSPRSTAIDHIFATGPIASHTHHVLPCHTSHAMVLAQVTLHHCSCDAHSWRLFRWRLATVEDMDSLSAALDLAWGWLSLTPSLPDHYIAAHHFLAHQLLPHPPDTPTLLRSLARFTFPLSTQDLAAQSFALREASSARGYVSRAGVLSSPSITSATRTVLRVPSPPLEPFHGILPHPGATLTTREERLAQVTAQSRSQTANRHVSVDHAFFAARCTPDPWLPLLHPPTDLTLPLLRDALRANARPESPASLRAYALTRQSPPPSSPPPPSPTAAWASAPSPCPLTTWRAQRSSAAAEASTSDCCTSSSSSNAAPRASPTRPSATASTRGSPPSHSPGTSHAPSAPSTWSRASPAQRPASPRPA